MAAQTQACTRCHQKNPLDHVNFSPASSFGRAGIEYAKTCRGCQKKKDDALAKKRVTAENTSGAGQNTAKKKSDNMSVFAALNVLSLDGFVAKVSAPNRDKILTTIISLPMDSHDVRKRADALAKVIWDATDYRFK
ncbi:hypothetical protein CPB85DRAFT_1255036 [Mucidula mucida]|nr:hypothetical protein CPB85DRAFT_1255036 [Mucidula mucida]